MSTRTSNQACWLLHKQAYPYTVDEAPMPTLGDKQVLVRIRAVAINPADWVVQKLGIVYESFPCVPGVDFAGDVIELGSGVEHFKIGDRVAGLLNNGAFQFYCAGNESMMTKIPDHISYTQGCVVPLGFATAAVCLFEKDMLALEYPKIGGAESNGKALVVWGGSSALGSCAIQQARAAGYEVVATASEHNFEYCQRLGAQHVFDHRSDKVVQDVVNALEGKDSAGVFCAVNAKKVVGKCGEIATSIGGNKCVAIPLPPAVPVPDPVPEDVRVAQCWHSGIEGSAAAAELIRTWLPDALVDGTMKCRPEPEIVGDGLKDVQDAVDKLRKGVSAKKLVVELA